MRNELLTLRSSFRPLRDGCYRQLGLRAIKDALALEGRNLAREAELLGKAKHYLAYAEAAQ